jgi:hypothetical protein
MAKTYPSTWTTRQVAYFAGILTARIGIDELKRIVDERASAQPNQLYFSDLVEHLEPRISVDQWAGCVENCQRIFGRVL